MVAATGSRASDVGRRGDHRRRAGDDYDRSVALLRRLQGELLDRPMVEADVTLMCVSNEVGGDLIGNARWLGVPLASLLREMTGPQPRAGDSGNAVSIGPVALGPAKDQGKNTPVIERLQELVARLCGGRDVTQLPGLSVHLVLQLISEVGTDMTRWRTEKHFTSWLGLAGGRKQSGKRKGNVKAHRNRAGRMFCAAARSLARSVDKALGGFYRRLRGRLGGLAANVALARKLALLFYRLLRYGMGYVEQGLKNYEAKVLETETRLLRKLARKQGFTLTPN